MNFALDEEQLMLQQSIRKFVQREIKPILVDYYNRRDPKDPRPAEIRKKLHDMGLYALGFDSKWGGSGASLVTQAMVCEEVGAGDMNFSGGF